MAAVVVRDARAAETTIGVMRTENYTPARRSAGIDRIVVHVTEGGFWGSVSWLRNSRSYGSSHFVVSREGEIVQLVNLADVAWHAGNNYMNWHSIGIEHEGYTSRGGFTEAEYESSARLLAYLSARLGIPLDRRHVIGHDEVSRPGRHRPRRLRPPHRSGPSLALEALPGAGPRVRAAAAGVPARRDDAAREPPTRPSSTSA